MIGIAAPLLLSRLLLSRRSASGDSVPGVSKLSRSPFSPWQGEKVADRPDEGASRP